jgi:hypothetical protein
MYVCMYRLFYNYNILYSNSKYKLKLTYTTIFYLPLTIIRTMYHKLWVIRVDYLIANV